MLHPEVSQKGITSGNAPKESRLKHAKKWLCSTIVDMKCGVRSYMMAYQSP